jgi:cell division protein FtsX
MSSKVKGYVVTLENDINEEQSKKIEELLMMISGVVGVTPVQYEGASDIITASRVKREITERVLQALK